MQHLQFLKTLLKRVHFNFRHHRTNIAISPLFWMCRSHGHVAEPWGRKPVLQPGVSGTTHVKPKVPNQNTGLRTRIFLKNGTLHLWIMYFRLIPGFLVGKSIFREIGLKMWAGTKLKCVKKGTSPRRALGTASAAREKVVCSTLVVGELRKNQNFWIRAWILSEILNFRSKKQLFTTNPSEKLLGVAPRPPWVARPAPVAGGLGKN